MVTLPFTCFLLLLPVVVPTVVNTPFGEIEGLKHETAAGVPVDVFLGLRYGQAPEGELRFKKPEMVKSWAPERLVATEHGVACYPFIELAIPPYGASEDCLFMNIITPGNSGDKLPVLVFIPGGGYEVGSVRDYGYKRLAERIASKGVVVVTVQYRLGPLGFLSFGDSVVPGNLGLWDQTLALKFMREILPSFGGDVSRITVSGESAGAFSTSALQFSPHSRDLFNQAFEMSGSILSESAMSDNVVDQSRKLAEKVGCWKGASEEIIECLQKLPVRDLLRAVQQVGITRYHSNTLVYQARLDGDFFPSTAHELIKQSEKKNSVMGLATHEAAIFVLIPELAFLSGLVVPKEQWNDFSREKLVSYIRDYVAPQKDFGEYADKLQELITEYYASGNKSSYLEQFIEIHSDLIFLIPFYEEAVLKLKNGWNTWLYVNEHTPKSTPRDHLPVVGAFHGDELLHFSDMHIFEKIDDSVEEDAAFGRAFIDGLIAFVKTGDPSTSELKWPKISPKTPFVHAALSSKSEIRQAPYREDALKLWMEAVPSAVPIEILRKSRLPGAVEFASPQHNEL